MGNIRCPKYNCLVKLIKKVNKYLTKILCCIINFPKICIRVRIMNGVLMNLSIYNKSVYSTVTNAHLR